MTTVWCLVVTALLGAAELSTGAFVDQRSASANSITSSYSSFATVAGPVSTGAGGVAGGMAASEAAAAVTSSDLPRQIPAPQSRPESSTQEYDEQVPSLRMLWVTRDPHADVAAR